MRQKGQAIIILLLIILISLSIGLAVVQNSLNDVSTSTRTDQGSRAFSAAEAGLEKALLNNSTSTIDLLNNSTATVSINQQLPDPTVTGQALEYPPITKVDFAQFWFLDPVNLASLGSAYTSTPTDYVSPTFTIYFGNCNRNPCEASIDSPAVEVNVTVFNKTTSVYTTYRSYWDSATRTNNFTKVNTCSASGYTPTNGTSSSATSNFYCNQQINWLGQASVPSNLVPVLARVRILYSNSAQKLALAPDSTKKLPVQASIYTSKGTSGETTRQIKVFREKKVVPYYFDFAIFSNTAISK